VFEWRKTAHPLDESAKSLAGILEDQRRAGFKAVMTLQQGPGEEAGHVFGLANVHSDVQGLIQEHRDRFEIRMLLGWSLCHRSLLLGWQPGNASTMFFSLIITPQVYSAPGRRQGAAPLRYAAP
jgi:hypothetical protein